MPEDLGPYVILPPEELERRLAGLARRADRLRGDAREGAEVPVGARARLGERMAAVMAEAAHLVVLQDLLVTDRRN